MATIVAQKKKKETVRLPFSLLPEGKLWGIGQKYRVEMVLKMVALDQRAAEFEIVNAKSTNKHDKLKRSFMSGDKYNE